MNKTKKIIAVFCACLSLFATNISAYAAEPVSSNSEAQTAAEHYEGVSPISPETETRTTSRPSSVWDVSSSGKYTFSGTSYYQTLYTNYKFKGKTSYTIYVYNGSSYNMTVKAKTLLTTYAKTTVGPGESATLSLSGMDKSTEFYITFDGDYMDFSGYIK